MAIDIIGGEQATSGVLGAGAKVFENSFGLFGKISSTIQPGTYVITSTAGNKGGTALDTKRLTSGASGISVAGQVAIDEVAVAESGIILASRSSKQVFPVDSKMNDEIPSSASPNYQGRVTFREFYVASNSTTTVIAVYSATTDQNSVRYWEHALWTKVGSGGWTRTLQVASNSSNDGPTIDRLEFTNGRFIARRRSQSSSNPSISTYPNVLLVSTDGLTWSTVTPAAPYGGTADTAHYPACAGILGTTYFMRANNETFLATTTNLTSFTNIEPTMGSAFQQFWQGTPNKIGISGTEIVLTTTNANTSNNGISILYSTNSGGTWQIPTTIPTGYRWFTNAVKSGGKWYIAASRNADGFYDLLVSTDLVTWTTFDIGSGGQTANQDQDTLQLVPGNNGWRIGGNNDRYAFWTTQTNPETTSWQTASTSTNIYDAMWMANNYWLATDDNYATALRVNTTAVGQPNSWSAQLLVTNMSGQPFDSNQYFPPDYAYSQPAGATVIGGRAIVSGNWRNMYLHTNSTSPTSTSNWTRFYAPIGLTSSQIPVVRYLPTAGYFHMSNQSTGEFATSVNGTTWTIGSGTFTFGINNGNGTNAQGLTLGSSDLLFTASNENLFLTSTAGGNNASWTLVTNPFGVGKPTVNVIEGYNNGLLFVTNAGHIITTTNGTTFTTSKPFSSQAVAYTFGTEIIARGSLNGQSVWRRSTDNVTWTTLTNLNANIYTRIGKSGNKYIAFGSTLNIVAYSSDATTWDTMAPGGLERNFEVVSNNDQLGSTSTSIDVPVLNNGTANRQASFATFDATEKYGFAYYNSTFTEV